MENARIVAASAVVVLIFAVMASMLSADEADSQEQPRKVRFVTSYGTGHAWNPYNGPEDLDPAERFLSELDEAAASEIETFLVDLGRLATPATIDETYYDYPGAVALREREYAAAHATPYDLAYGGSAGYGVRARPHTDDHFIGTIDAPASVTTGAPVRPSITRESEVLGAVTFVALGERESIYGLPWLYERVTEVAHEEALEAAIEEGDEHNAGLYVLLSDLQPENLQRLVEAHPQLNLVLTTTPGPATADRLGESWVVPRHEAHEIQIITVEFDAEGAIDSLEIERREWLDEETFAALVNPPLPQIGVSVRPPQRLAERLEFDAATINLDVFRSQPIPELTPRENVYIYRIEKDDVQYHVIRVLHRLRNGWVNFDVLAQIDLENDSIVHLETNLPDYPLSYLSTRMADVFSHLYGKPVDEWDYPRHLVAGLEMQADEVLLALQRALEVNRRLFDEQAGDNQTD